MLRLRIALLFPICTGLILGLYAILNNGFLSPAFLTVAHTFGSFRAWGALWLLCSAVALVASCLTSVRLVRLALGFSAIMVASMLGGVLADWWLYGQFWPSTMALSFGYLGFHITILGMPMREIPAPSLGG